MADAFLDRMAGDTAPCQILDIDGFLSDYDDTIDGCPAR
jgi:hypothetical protein